MDDTTKKSINDAIKYVGNNLKIFPNGYENWIVKNHHIWVSFEEETFKLVSLGHRRVSALTTIGFLRHQSMLREYDSKFKISNNHAPYMSRIFTGLHPEHKYLFEQNELTSLRFSQTGAFNLDALFE